MKQKNKIVVATLLMSVILLAVGTIAYFRRQVTGTISGQTGDLVLIVNEADAKLNEEFEIVLRRSANEDYIYPGDSGTFDINIISTGSSSDVEVTITFSRINLPNNLKFYSDTAHTQEITTSTYFLEYAPTMEKTVPVYWYWDGTKDDENDTLFSGQILTANIIVTAEINRTLYGNLFTADWTLDTNVNFSAGASESNGQGLMMSSGTENNENPILYYRGDVSNNNVIFADLCWLIVRTTETGGVKLIYNGEVNSDGSCTNYTGVGSSEANSAYENVYINNEKYKFNNNKNQPVYAGYMYNDDTKYFDASTRIIDKTAYNSFLENKNIDQGTGRYIQNKYDSNAKSIIEIWYEENIKGKAGENLIEDTVWCNDRGGSHYNDGIFDCITYSDSLKFSCNRDIDKFTVNRENGNGDLEYPIGMLTWYEIYAAGNYKLTGSTDKNFLTRTSYWDWTLTPSKFNYGLVFMHPATGGGYEAEFPADETTAGIRPAISLVKSAVIDRGDGSFEKPYVIG